MKFFATSARPALCAALFLQLAAIAVADDLPAPLGDTTEWRSYGAPVSTDLKIRKLGKVLAKPRRHLSRALVVEAPVQDVCAVKGCWMLLTDGKQEVRVTFKDYGFFVPRDIQGARARIEGVFSVVEVPVDLARHYLEDAGKHEEAALITEPQRSFTIEATGVMLRREPK